MRKSKELTNFTWSHIHQSGVNIDWLVEIWNSQTDDSLGSGPILYKSFINYESLIMSRKFWIRINLIWKTEVIIIIINYYDLSPDLIPTKTNHNNESTALQFFAITEGWIGIFRIKNDCEFVLFQLSNCSNDILSTSGRLPVNFRLGFDNLPVTAKSPIVVNNLVNLREE